ncbi:MAG: mechanosensitive ion channel [Eubacterium sp.]|nr:mechanosensitive ion channel [Eubacterium sp.]
MVLLDEGIIENAGEQLHKAHQFAQALWDGFLAYLPTLIFAIVILIVGYLISKLILKLMKKGMKRSVVDVTVTKFTYSLVKIVIYVLLITIVLAVLGVPMTSIIAVIGTAGVAIGLALKDSLSNIAGGFYILISKPFKIGDYIASDGVEGTVEAISIWYTHLHTHDNRSVFMPNGELVKSNIINYTYNPTRRLDLTFSISYRSDVEKAKQLLAELVKAHDKILDEPEAVIRVLTLGNSSVDIACRPWVKPENYWDVYFDLTEQAKKMFEENGIEIPYNQLDVHINS